MGVVEELALPAGAALGRWANALGPILSLDRAEIGREAQKTPLGSKTPFFAKRQGPSTAARRPGLRRRGGG